MLEVMEAALASSILFQDFCIASLLSQRYHGCDSVFVTLMRQEVKTFVTLFDLKSQEQLSKAFYKVFSVSKLYCYCLIKKS